MSNGLELNGVLNGVTDNGLHPDALIDIGVKVNGGGSFAAGGITLIGLEPPIRHQLRRDLLRRRIDRALRMGERGQGELQLRDELGPGHAPTQHAT